MTEYVVLIIGDPDRWWSTMTEEERQRGYAEYERFDKELSARGHTVVGGAELHSHREARTVHPGGQSITDGPYAETAEQVGGFYQVQTEDLDDLLDCCRIIAAVGDAVQVQRVVTAEERAG